MPGQPRIHFPGAGYHVMLRGNGRQDLFLGSADRSKFLLLLQQGVERYGHSMHAYCLTNHHVHFALKVSNVFIQDGLAGGHRKEVQQECSAALHKQDFDGLGSFRP
jgi:REP element-mobilizing transposase RayT